jgi:hypothetical protein
MISRLQSQSTKPISKSVSSNVVRNISSLDQTLAIVSPDFSSEHGIRPDILGPLLKMNQSLVPAVSRASQLARSVMTRRQRLFADVHRELVPI